MRTRPRTAPAPGVRQTIYRRVLAMLATTGRVPPARPAKRATFTRSKLSAARGGQQLIRQLVFAPLDIQGMALPALAMALLGAIRPRAMSDTMAETALSARSATPTLQPQEIALARRPMTRVRVPATQDSMVLG